MVVSLQQTFLTLKYNTIIHPRQYVQRRSQLNNSNNNNKYIMVNPNFSSLFFSKHSFCVNGHRHSHNTAAKVRFPKFSWYEILFYHNIHFVFLLLNIRNFLQQHLQGNAHALFVAEIIKESLEILNFKEFMINDESKV